MGHELDGCNALVTGGGSGLGLACADRLRADGATVTIVGRTESRLLDGVEALRAVDGPGEVRCLTADVTDEGAVAEAVARADGGGGLSIVVASAGVGWLAPIPTIPLDAWRSVMEINLTGNFLTLKHAAPRMRIAGGGAYTVRFLSGPEAAWITGVNLPVDGGHHLRRAPRFDGYVRREHGSEWLPVR